MIPKRHVLITITCALTVICASAPLYGIGPATNCTWSPDWIRTMNPDPEATPVPYGESCGGGPGLIWDDIFLGYYLGHTGSNVAYWSEYQCPGLVTQPVYFSEIIGAGEYEINDVSFDGCYEDCAENAGCAQWSGGSDYGFFVDFDPSVFNISPVYWTGGGSFTVTLANTDCETLMAVENSPIKVYVECAVQGKCSSLGENGEGSCGCDYDDCWIEKYEYFLFGPYVYYVSISAEVEDYCDAISGGGGGGGDGGGGICSSSLCFGPGMSVTPGSTPGASIGSIVGFGSGTPGR